MSVEQINLTKASTEIIQWMKKYVNYLARRNRRINGV